MTVAWDYGESGSPPDEARLGSLLGFALEREGADPSSWSFAIRFVSDAEMMRLHEAWLGDPSATDIMTFPYDDEDGEKGGDILISVDTAAANASEHGWATDDELRFLVVHGLLHILGWDDHSDSDRAAMLQRQRALINAWHRERAG